MDILRSVFSYLFQIMQVNFSVAGYSMNFMSIFITFALITICVSVVSYILWR